MAESWNDLTPSPFGEGGKDAPKPAQPAREPIAALLGTVASVDPGFLDELETLSIPIAEYERMLSEDTPTIITTDNTVG